ncbi:MAG: DUF3256 family protein [Bacteroidaceae bacterium]|nr:DUF3256 family protein [Bacteroidaceae bacterium]
MKKLIIIIIAVWSVVGSLSAQTIKQIFQTLPDTILPSLTKNDRLDLIDLFENNMSNEVNNQLRGKSRMTHLDDNLTKIRLSELTEVQLCRLATPTSYLICLIHSVKTDAWDSTIRFYNPDWTLNSKTTILNTQRSTPNAQLSFTHLDFTNDTTLQLNTEAPTLTTLPVKETPEYASKGSQEVSLNWDSAQSRFVP